MSYQYADRKQAQNAAPLKDAAPLSPSMEALRSGAASPTAEQMGHRVDLPDAMREKMEEAFGADLSAVRLYESEAVADAGANAITQGSNIAFAPGMLDFTSFGGQALLGHELSHVVSQARGEVTGGGFLNDRALEARADREGAMAAAGQQVAMPTAAMSGATATAAAGPMQADKAEEKAKAMEDSMALMDSYNRGSDEFYKTRKNTSLRARMQTISNLKGAIDFQKRKEKGQLTPEELQRVTVVQDNTGYGNETMDRLINESALNSQDMLKMMRAARWGRKPRTRHEIARDEELRRRYDPDWGTADFYPY